MLNQPRTLWTSELRARQTRSAAALTSQINVIALLGHTNYELSFRRREAVKYHLNKEYGSLCSSQTPVTTLLFGDELQAQLTAIRALNRISHTAC